MTTFDDFVSQVATFFEDTGHYYAEQRGQDIHLGLAWRALCENQERFTQPSVNNPSGDPIVGLITSDGDWWIQPFSKAISPRLVYPSFDAFFPIPALTITGTPNPLGVQLSWSVMVTVAGEIVQADEELTTSNSFYGLVMLQRYLDYHMNIDWNLTGFLHDLPSDLCEEPLLPAGFTVLQLRALFSPLVELVVDDSPSGQSWSLVVDGHSYPVGISDTRDISIGQALARDFFNDVTFSDVPTPSFALHLVGRTPPERYIANEFNRANWIGLGITAPSLPTHHKMLTYLGVQEKLLVSDTGSIRIEGYSRASQ